MGFKIVTDSASDIPQETAAKWGVTVMPIHARFGDEEYLDGVTLTPHQFFEKVIKTGEIPHTSQVTPYEFRQEFKKAIDAGQDVLCLTMPANMSGTYQNACTAAAEFGDKVIVLDSRQLCIAFYVLVEYACRCRDEGRTVAQTVEAVEKVKHHAHVISVFSTLEYLRRGGRISPAAAMAGNLLSIKPVITVVDGCVEVVGRARGSKKANDMLVRFIRSVGGIDYSMPYCLGYTGFSEETLTRYVDDNAAAYKELIRDVPVVPVGATIGTYAGPGAVAIAFFDKSGREELL